MGVCYKATGVDAIGNAGTACSTRTGENTLLTQVTGVACQHLAQDKDKQLPNITIQTNLHSAQVNPRALTPAHTLTHPHPNIHIHPLFLRYVLSASPSVSLLYTPTKSPTEAAQYETAQSGLLTTRAGAPPVPKHIRQAAGTNAVQL